MVLSRKERRKSYGSTAIPVLDGEPKVDMISKFHILEYIRRMCEKTGNGVTTYELQKYFRTDSIGTSIRRLQRAGYLRIGESQGGLHNFKRLVLGAKSENFLKQYRLEDDLDGFLSKKNPRIDRYLNKPSVQTQLQKKLHGPFVHELPFPID